MFFVPYLTVGMSFYPTAENLVVNTTACKAGQCYNTQVQGLHISPII